MREEVAVEGEEFVPSRLDLDLIAKIKQESVWFELASFACGLNRRAG
jgi:hypothetical protein